MVDPDGVKQCTRLTKQGLQQGVLSFCSTHCASFLEATLGCKPLPVVIHGMPLLSKHDSRSFGSREPGPVVAQQGSQLFCPARTYVCRESQSKKQHVHCTFELPEGSHTSIVNSTGPCFHDRLRPQKTT